MVTLNWRRISFICLAIGWVLCAYLLLRMMSLGIAFLPWKTALSASSVCKGCDDALTSAAAFARGIPLPAIGLMYFALIASIVMLGGVWMMRLALLVGAGGTGTSLFLSARLLASYEPGCDICLLVHAANVALVAALFVIVVKQQRQPSLFGSARSLAVVSLLVVITSGTVQAMVFTRRWDPSVLIARYHDEPFFEIRPDADDAVLGPADGRIRLVVFSSFQCPWCRAFESVLYRLREHFGDTLTMVFKNFPLDKACNPVLKTGMQPHACAAAWAAQAANLQNAFWRYHDFLFAGSLDDSDEMLRAAASKSGLDVDRWQSDRHSSIVRLKVQRDLMQGLKLKVDGTPAVFLDGRHVTKPTLTVLETLIREEIKGGGH